MASINARNGQLFFDFRYKGQRCREYTKLTDTPAHRKRMETIMARIEAEITLDIFVYGDYFPGSKKAEFFDDLNKKVKAGVRGVAEPADDMPTLGEFTEVWLSEMRIEWRDSYIKSITGAVNSYMLPAFGDRKVSDITKADILQFRSTLAKEPLRKSSPLKASSINKALSPLRMILNEAAERYDFNSPFRGIKTLRVQRVDVEPFTLEEVRMFLDNVREDFHSYYTLRFFTGMRPGEIDGLQWKYVDFERRQILIRETLVQNKMTYTKTDGSQREIYMSQPVYEALKEQYKITDGGRFVFCNRDGKALANNNVTKRVWHPTLRYLGLKRRPPYQSRHTAATLWLAAGESPEWIARQMGHTTTEMLFRVYSRYVPNLTRQDGSAFERLLQQEQQKNED